jgi:PAS domain-containing protein
MEKNSNENVLSYQLLALQKEIDDLTTQNQQLRENEKKFRFFFEKSTDPFLIIKNFRFIDCNQSALKLLNVKNLEDLFSTHPSSISPEFQPDGRTSILKANEMMDIALKNGQHSFLWRHIDANKSEFDVIVSLTPILVNNEVLIFTHWTVLNTIQEFIRLQFSK